MGGWGVRGGGWGGVELQKPPNRAVPSPIGSLFGMRGKEGGFEQRCI